MIKGLAHVREGWETWAGSASSRAGSGGCQRPQTLAGRVRRLIQVFQGCCDRSRAGSTQWQPGGSPTHLDLLLWEGDEPWQPPGDVPAGMAPPWGHPKEIWAASSGCPCPALVGPELLQRPLLTTSTLWFHFPFISCLSKAL